MSDLVSYNLRPKDLPEEIALNVRAIIEIFAKSYSTLFRTISLLKLPPEIRAAIRAGTLPVSRGAESKTVFRREMDFGYKPIRYDKGER